MSRSLVILVALGGVALAMGSAADEARALLHDEDARAAIAVCESAIARGEDDAALRAVRGRAALVLGRMKVAKEDLERAARDGDLDPEGAFALARTRLLYDDPKGAASLAGRLGRPERARLEAVLDGPFQGRTPVRSPGGHYLVFSDVGVVGTESTGAREAAKFLEASRHACLELLPFLEDEKVVLRAYVFARKADFERFTRLVDDDEVGESDGAFCEELRVLTVDASGPSHGPRRRRAQAPAGLSDAVRGVIFHESCHQLVSFYAPGLPSWLDEGLAEWFGATRVLPSGEIEVGVLEKHVANDTSRYEDMQHAVADGTALSLARFMALSDGAFEREQDADRNYAEAWAVLRFFMTDPARRKTVTTYLELLHAGKKRDEAFAATFGKLDLEALDREFRRYLAAL